MNTPSDVEIEKLAAEHIKAFSQFPMGGQVWFEGEVEFARAVLAKRGQQAQPGAVGLMEDLPSAIHILQRENKEMKELLREHGIKYPQHKAVLLTNRG